MSDNTPNSEFKSDVEGLRIDGKDIKLAYEIHPNNVSFTHLIINCNSMVSGRLAASLRLIFGELANVQVLPNSDEIIVRPNIELLKKTNDIDRHVSYFIEQESKSDNMGQHY